VLYEIALTDNTGVVTDTYTYDEFGVEVSSTGSSYNPLRFTGQQLDGETGFYYLRNRYYDPATGRFIGRDPITWINVEGLRDVNLLHEFGRTFAIHSLALADVVNVHQRPKVEEYDANTYIVMRIPVSGDHADSEQIGATVDR